jgi:hypothetical protein
MLETLLQTHAGAQQEVARSRQDERRTSIDQRHQGAAKFLSHARAAYQQADEHGRIDERNGRLASGTSPSFLARRDLPASVATDLKLPRYLIP